MAINTKTVTILQKLAKYAVPSEEESIECRVKSIPHDIILKPNIAIGIYLQEAYNLYYYAQADKENLCSKGLDWRLMDELPQRIEFLRLCEARWYSIRYSETPSAKEFQRLHSIIDKARKELLVTMLYAFTIDSQVNIIKRIEQGKEPSEYMQSLCDIVKIADSHMTELQAVGCDLSHVEVLREHQLRYMDLFAMCTLDEEDKAEALHERDRAYTFLVVAIEAIRRTAHLAFWNDKKRLRGYASEYFRKSTRKKSLE
jgi:hypothetical protein